MDKLTGAAARLDTASGAPVESRGTTHRYLLAKTTLRSRAARSALDRFRIQAAREHVMAALSAAHRAGVPAVVAETSVLASRVYEIAGDLPTAAEHAARALDILDGTCPSDIPGTKAHNRAALSSHMGAVRQLATVTTRQGDYRTAERLFLRAIDLAVELHGRMHLQVALDYNSLGVLYKAWGRYDRAEAAYSQAHQRLQAAGAHSHPLMATVLHNLGGLAFARGDLEVGQAYAARSVELRTRLHGAAHPDVVADVAARASLLAQQGRLAEAAAGFELAMATFERLYGRCHFEWAVNANNLGVVLARRGLDHRAEQLLCEVVQVKEAVCGPDSVDVAITLVNLIDLYLRSDRIADAEKLLTRADAIARIRVDPEHPVAVALAERSRRVPHTHPTATNHGPIAEPPTS